MDQDSANLEEKNNNSPLSQWYRQPKIYVSLPSKGKFYPEGSLDISTNDQYAVYAMTAKDELMFKTPDALLSGQSTVEVIKSCIPAIKDPWVMPSIDLDFCLIAIRLATYGEKMDITAKCPSCDHENEYEMSLSTWLSIFDEFEYKDKIDLDPLTVYIRPYTYREVTKTSIKALEQQKIFNVVNDNNLSDEQKLDLFGESFVKITELTVDIIADCIHTIDTPNGSVSEKSQIKEFINNCSKDMFDVIQSHITNIKEQVELKVPKVECNECQTQYDIPVTLDQANFFGVRS
jgi:hypothetical protein